MLVHMAWARKQRMQARARARQGSPSGACSQGPAFTSQATSPKYYTTFKNNIISYRLSFQIVTQWETPETQTITCSLGLDVCFQPSLLASPNTCPVLAYWSALSFSITIHLAPEHHQMFTKCVISSLTFSPIGFYTSCGYP